MPSLEPLRRFLGNWLSPRRAMTASIVTFSAVALVAAVPGSPYHPVLPVRSTGGPIGLLARLLLLDRVPPGVMIVVGLVAMVSAGLAFLLILWVAARGEIKAGTVLRLSIAYNIVILLLPLLLSRDVFSYAYYGRILTEYGKNPYAYSPAHFPANDLAAYVWPGWRDTPSVYGPVFVWISAAITGIFRSRNLADLIFVFRAVAVAASLGSLWFVFRLMQKIRPGKAAFAVAIIGLNPVVLFHTVGGGHVDALVMLAVAAAIYLVATERALLATAVLTMGSLVKVSAAVPLVLLIAFVVVKALPERRLRVLATHAATAIGIALVAAFPLIQRENPTLGMIQIVQHGSWIAPPALVERIFEAIGKLLAGGAGATIGIAIARLGMYAALAAGLFFILRQVIRRGADATPQFLAAAWGWSFLLMMLFSPALFPWYFCWVLPVAWALPRVPRHTLEFSFLALVTAQLSTENVRLPEWMHIDLAIGHPILILVLFWFVRDLWYRVKYDVPLDAEVDLSALRRSVPGADGGGDLPLSGERAGRESNPQPSDP